MDEKDDTTDSPIGALCKYGSRETCLIDCSKEGLKYRVDVLRNMSVNVFWGCPNRRFAVGKGACSSGASRGWPHMQIARQPARKCSTLSERRERALDG
jgi:hypothetical protein